MFKKNVKSNKGQIVNLKVISYENAVPKLARNNVKEIISDVLELLYFKCLLLD